MGSNNSGRGVGGSMVHYAPRLHLSDFMTHSLDGVGAAAPGGLSLLPRWPYLDRSWAVAVATPSTVLRCGFVHGPGLRR